MSLDSGTKSRTSPWELAVAPPPEKWDDWVELDPAAWPERRERHYALVPTICFNCEAQRVEVHQRTRAALVLPSRHSAAGASTPW